jgi:hypothetical protein
VTMFPKLADAWLQQTSALQGWKNFTAADFERLKQVYGVNWVLVQAGTQVGLACPYRNQSVAVCEIK